MSSVAKARCRAVVVAVLAATAVAAAPPLPSGPEIRVSTDETRGHYYPAVAVFPDGGFVVAWATDHGELRARFFDRDGQPTGGERPLPVRGATWLGDVVARPDGSFLVVANETGAGGRSVLVQRFGRDGKPRGAVARANDQRDAYPGAVLAVAPDGGFAVAWTSEVRSAGDTYLDAVGRIFDAKGRPRTPEIVLLPGTPSTRPFPDDARNAFPLALTLGRDGTLTLLAQHAAPCVKNFLLRLRPGASRPTDAGLGSVDCAAGRSHGALALSRNGSLVVAWREQEVRARRFAPGGAPRDEPFAVSERPSVTEEDAALAQQADGFVVAWADSGGRDGDGYGIFARAFTPQGVPRTADFQVNVTTAGDATDPRVAASRRGAVVAVWMGYVRPFDRPQIYARLLTAAP